MAKMFPPEGSSGHGPKPNKDGSYDIPEDKVFEMKAVHGYRLAGDTGPLTTDQMSEQTETRRRESADFSERLAVLQAENQTLITANKRLTAERDGLATQLRRAAK